MPNTYHQMPVHTVWAVRNRAALLADDWRDDLHKYMTGVIKGHGLPMLAVNSVDDHIHALFEMHPNLRLSDVMRELKHESSRWINEHRLTRGRFNWQEGYGAFNVSRRHVPIVGAYIAGQQEHHGKQGFRDEITTLYRDEEIDFDERYLFRDPE
ncbi:MAG: IS200/IS605 family transposase [Chitinophagaceae bacterium]|nr:MAG: IS200/IS605 family transposase [Chitinophagaceae bacterium]